MTNYTEKFELWSATTLGVWEEKDLGVAPFNVPSGAIAEIVFINFASTKSYSVGIRPSGSTLDRRITISDTNPSGGQQYMTMHVPLESGTVIEHYSQNTAIGFRLVGYWAQGTYVATSGQFSLPTDIDWQNQNLAIFGVQNDDIVEIIVGNADKLVSRSGGVRESGSTIQRKITFDKIGVNGINSVTMMVKAIGLDATIQGFSSDGDDIDFHVIGYWRSNSLTFIERFIDLGSGTIDGAWEGRDLSGSGIVPKSVVEAALLNQEPAMNTLGIRPSGSSVDRSLSLTDVISASGTQVLTMHSSMTDTSIETFIGDTTKDHQFLLLGSWEPTPIDSSIVLFIKGLDIITSDIDLVALGKGIHSSELDLFLSGNEILSSNINLFLKGTTTPYIEMIQEWSPITSGVWETKDLSVAPFNIPSSAVLEIAISNSTAGANDPAYSGGVRAVGSSIDRTIEIHPAELGGKNFVVMHVQSDTESKIETFAEHLTFNQFTLLGFWVQGQYTEVSGILNVTVSNTWQGRDLTSFGIPAGAVTEILLGNKVRTTERSIGVRSSGSILERKFNIHEAEDSGIDSLTLFTNTTSGSTNIEIYSQNITDVDFILLGYWSQPPMEQFTEILIDIGEATSDATWEPQDLSTLLPLDINLSSVLEVVVGSNEGGLERELGIRQSGSTQDRFLDLHEAEAGGLDFVRMHTNIDGNKTVEIYEESAASVSDFIIAGYWQDSPSPIASLDLFIRGRRPFPQLRSKKLYFTNTAFGGSSIDRANLDGSNWESMIDPSHIFAPATPQGLALDTIGRHVYWTDLALKTIMRMGLEIPVGETISNRSDVEILMSGVAGIGTPSSFDIHITSGLMFFTTTSPNVLVSGHMNIPSGETFSTRTDLVQVGAGITSLAVIIDEIEDRYYIKTFSSIQRATLTEPTRETISTDAGGSSFGGVGQDTVFGDIYFVNIFNDNVHKIEQDGQGDVEVIFDSPSGELLTTRNIFVDETEDQRTIYFSDSIDFIARLNLDGTGFERIIEDFVAPDFKTLDNPNELAVLQIPFINSDIALFIHGPEPIESSLNLFIVGPLPASSEIDLFIAGPIQATSGLDLFIIGPVQVTGTITLAGLRPSGFIGELDLFLDKKDLISDTIILFMEAPVQISGVVDLYIANSGVPLSFTAFMKGDINLDEDDIPLFMRGTDTSGSVFFQDGSIDLYLKTIGDPTDSPTAFDTSLFMRVASGFLDTNNAWGLFLKSNTNLNKDLEMSITGTLGGTLVSGDVTLFMESFFDNDNWLLFLKTQSGTQDTVDLFMSGVVADPIGIQTSSTLMTSGIGVSTAEIDLFLFNEPPLSSGSVTMFLATTPLISEESMQLYSHGF